MSTEKFTQLPTVPSSTSADIICAVQGGISTQQTLSQILALSLSNTVLNFAGNPNTHVAGTTFQLLWDTTNHILYICTTAGNAASAVWTATGVSGLVTPAEGGTGTATPTAHGVAVGEGSSTPFNFLTLSNGQLLIGSTGLDPVPATITAGTNITVTPGAGTLEISASGVGGFSWSTVAGTSQAMVSNSGYITSNVGLTTFTLPMTSSVGDELKVVGKGSGGWTITYGASQLIQIGSSASTTTSGSISSTNEFDSINLVCTVANTSWESVGGPQGNLTIA
jgi:hypothetical protein